MTKEEIKIGARVVALESFADVPKGTEGIIIDNYGTGIMVAWDKPDKPYPQGKTPFEVNAMFAVNHLCPLRDGFGMDELDYLAVMAEEYQNPINAMKRKIKL